MAMKRKIQFAALILAAPALGGCALQAALIAAQVAPQIRAPMGTKNAHLRPTALEQCTARAGQHGSVFIVDVEQRRADRIIVWGSVTNAAQQRRTFECHFTTSLTSFRLGDVLAGS
jgi:hypothetical protein